MKKTSLYENHLALGATMVEFAGFSMPLQYSSIKAEHIATRTSAGLFDVSHMGEISVRGKDATALLSRVVTSDVMSLKPFKMTYGLFLNEQGGIIDDLMVYKFSNDEYMLVVNASNVEKDLNWLIEQKNHMDVQITDLSNFYSLIALQGPKAEEVLNRFVHFSLSDMNPLHVRNIDMVGAEYIVSRSGYTGEDGFEIYGSHADIRTLFSKLIEEEEVQPCGLGARDTLRFEAAMPLYGHELREDITPLEAQLTFALDFSKDFIGSDALKKQKEAGLKRKLVGLELVSMGVIRSDYPVVKGDKEVGFVTTGYLIPGTTKSYAMAYVEIEYAVNKTELGVRVRNQVVDVVVRNRKFYDKKNKK